MFYYIEGTVALLEPNLAVIDAGGVGYACHTSASTLSRLEAGKKARLYTYCHIKEDAFDLYGFYDLSEKRFFDLLLTVSGVVPKAALSILSSGTPESLALAIATGDERALTGAPGVGKKLAQRVILELKDKIAKSALQRKGEAPEPMPAAGGVEKVREASEALAVLGYSQQEIAAALRKLDLQTLSVEEIVREVLKNSL